MIEKFMCWIELHHWVLMTLLPSPVNKYPQSQWLKCARCGTWQSIPDVPGSEKITDNFRSSEE